MIMEQLDLATVNRLIPIGTRRVCLGELGTVHSGIMLGDYLLKDNSYSASTVWGQEKGIFLNAHQYLDLEYLPPYEMDISQALGCFRATGFSLPTRKELQLLQQHRAALNNSLTAVGRENALIPEIVEYHFWCAEDIATGVTGYRRIIFIKNVEDIQSDVLHINCHRDKSPFSVDGIEVAHNDYADPYWLLQRINGWFYVLESRCKCFLYTPNDTTCNGRYYLENEQLVVENPTGEVFYDDKTRYVKTIKDYFRKDQYGLYRKVGTAEGTMLAPFRDIDD